jgi:hypothetical protein
MTRLVRDHVDIDDPVSLDHLIDALIQVRAGLPDGAEDARIRMRGDDVFGRRLTVSFLRPQTDAEAAREARYGGEGAPLSAAA